MLFGTQSTPLATNMHASTPLHSVIVPLYNEEESVELLYEAITAAMTSRPYNYELLFVNDGSSDGTFIFPKQKFRWLW